MSARDRETAEALVRLAASLDGAVLGLGTAAVAVASWVKYLAVSGQLRLVASAATASIGDARSLLRGDGNEPRIAAVRGYVRTQGSFLRAPFSSEAGVVVKHTQMVSPAVVRWRLARCGHRSEFQIRVYASPSQ
jgi:E3 ubiquitin-protein ligase MUL1